MTINDLRKKTSDEKLAKKAKNLIKEWKNLVDKREDKKEKAPKNEPSSSSSTKNNGTVSNQQASRVTPPASQSPAPVPSQYHSSNFPPKHLENDEVRLKSAQMILNALRYAELPVGTLDPEEIAVKVEEKLFTVSVLVET
ncbi:hypothetical protein COOONC_25759 [Cooperia oncophora]